MRVMLPRLRRPERRRNEGRPRLGADEARWAVLMTVFGGDAEAWIDFLLERGSRRQVEEDLPFAIRAAEEARRER